MRQGERESTETDRTNGQRANPDVLTILYRIRRDEYSFVGKIDSSIDAHRPRWTESRYSIGFVFDSVLRKHRKLHAWKRASFEIEGRDRLYILVEE